METTIQQMFDYSALFVGAQILITIAILIISMATKVFKLWGSIMKVLPPALAEVLSIAVTSVNLFWLGNAIARIMYMNTATPYELVQAQLTLGLISIGGYYLISLIWDMVTDFMNELEQ